MNTDSLPSGTFRCEHTEERKCEWVNWDDIDRRVAAQEGQETYDASIWDDVTKTVRCAKRALAWLTIDTPINGRTVRDSHALCRSHAERILAARLELFPDSRYILTPIARM